MGFVRFETLPDFNDGDYGFDDTDSRGAWQMVPLGGAKYLRLKVVGASVASIESDNTGIASVKSAEKEIGYKNVYRINGKAKGPASIYVRGSQREVLARLQVEVKTPRNPFVQFFLVSDKKGRKTTTTMQDVWSWMERANRMIFWPQINVTFVLKSVQDVKVDMDLGDPIDFGSIGMMPFVKKVTPEEKRWHAITERGALGREVFNVFCVWNFIHSRGEEQFDAFVASKTPITAQEMEKSGANYNMCIIKDKAGNGIVPEWMVYAHEAGHYLEGFPFHYEGRKGFYPLMRGDGLIGARLLRRDADKMNP
jgi:hypothetical protein